MCALLVTWILPILTFSISTLGGSVTLVSSIDAVIVLAGGVIVATVTSVPVYLRWFLGFAIWICVVSLFIADGVPFFAPAIQVLVLSTPFVAVFLAFRCSARERRLLELTLLSIWWLQAIAMTIEALNPTPLAGYQIQDRVIGTLFGSGKGFYVAPLLLLVVLPIIWRRYKKPLACLLTIWAAALAVVGDAKLDLLWATVAVIGAALITVFRAPSGKRLLILVPALVLGAVVFSVVVLGKFGGVPAEEYIAADATSGTGKFAVASAMFGDSQFSRDESILLGAGAGQTVSYTAATQVFQTRVNSIAGVDLNSKYAQYFWNLATNNNTAGGGSSFSSPASSILGILGDAGLVGLCLYLVAFVYLVIVIVRAWPGAVLVAVWISYLFIGVLFNWLEFTEVAVALAVVTAVLSPIHRDPMQPELETPTAVNPTSVTVLHT